MGDTIKAEGEVRESEDKVSQYILKNWAIMLGTEAGLVEELRQGNMIAESNRSYFPKTKRAAFQVRMESIDRTSKVQIQQHLIGREDDMDAYRAEATGIWATIAAICQITEKYNIMKAKIRYGCDRKAALKNLQ